MLDRRKSLLLFLTLLPFTLALRSHQSQHHTLDASIERHQQHHDVTAETETETLHQSRNILRAWVRRDHLGRWHYHSEVTRDTRTYIPPHDAIAWLLFEPLAHTQGWDILSLATSPHANDMEQAYGAGYVEGIATHVRIYQLWSTIGKKRHPDVDTYIAKQDTFLRQRVASVTPDHPEYVYWTHIGLILAQLDGLVAGYATTVTDPKYTISLYDFWAMQLDGDMKDIERTLKVSERCDTMTRTQLLEFIATEGHCSAMIKWTHDDLLVTHATWADYEELLKMYKHYRFAFSDPHVKSQLSSFSSYPGFIWSSDDFYILDTGLVVTETTITILNDDLYENIPDSSVTSWLRTTIANRLSHTGHEWTQWFSRYNSGTYNCQWMIIDYKRFVKGAELKPGTLWLLEQIPGRIQIRDLTPLLSSTTYWSSNNLPYFMEINEASMYQHYATRYGEILEYEKSTRSKIMRREQEKITSLASLKRLARLNQYDIDPVSAGCPGEAIAARYDLAPMNGVKCDSGVILNGAVDAKVVNAAMVATMTTETVLGPSTDDQPPFDWSKIKSRTKPLGQPWKFDFGWIRTRPRL